IPDERNIVQSHEVAWSPDGAFVASSTRNGIVIWDAVTGKQRRTLNGPSGLLAWAPDSIHLASGVFDLTVWDTRTGKSTFVLKGYAGILRSLAWSHDGKRLASGDRAGTIKICDANTGKDVVTFQSPEKGSRDVLSLAWSPDDKYLAAVRNNRNVLSL